MSLPEFTPEERYHVFLAACRGKVPFESRALAEAVARRRRLARGRKGQAYKCSGCGKYHIGTPHPGSSR